MRRLVLALCAPVLALLLGCGAGGAGADDTNALPDAPSHDARSEVPADAVGDLPAGATDATMDAGEPDPEPVEPAVEPAAETVDADLPPDATPPGAVCAALGLPVRSFADAPDDPTLYATAADFTVNTKAGPWHFRQEWSGCETYLFIQDRPRQNSGDPWPKTLWERDVDWFLSRLPANAHVFFVPTSPQVAEVTASLALIEGQVEAFLAGKDEATTARWRQRVHVVTDTAAAIPGWLGQHFTNPAWGVGIDRLQRVRYLGSYADFQRYDATIGWFAPNLSMAANEARYYEFEALREAALQAQDATVVPVFATEVIEDEGWAGKRGTADVTLPDAAAMAGFDTLELDLTLNCVGKGELGECPAWDYDVNLFLCDVADPTACTTDIAHWITTYHREGRWVHDISGLLPLFEGGGLRRLQFYTTQKYEVTLSLRFSTAGKAARPFQTRFLWGTADFGPAYDDGFAPLDVPVPADATKVELMTVITGHGGVQPGNCAEFCKTTHTFTVNGHAHVLERPEAGTGVQCMLDVDRGTVPNQYGTWWYGRNGWCPGREVAPQIVDVTGEATPGESAALTYTGLYNGQPYPSGGAVIRMTSWLVFSK